jgi:hypothetical protein
MQARYGANRLKVTVIIFMLKGRNVEITKMQLARGRGLRQSRDTEWSRGEENNQVSRICQGTTANS